MSFLATYSIFLDHLSTVRCGCDFFCFTTLSMSWFSLQMLPIDTDDGNKKGITPQQFYFGQARMLAQQILSRGVLEIAHRPYLILEMEFYIDGELHADPFCHHSSEQLRPGQFYFHRVGTGYRGGTRKGMDFSCGVTKDLCEQENVGSRKLYGGMLVRSIQDCETLQVIEGPSLVVDRILERCCADSVRDLVCRVLKNDLCFERKDALLCFYLRPDATTHLVDGGNGSARDQKFFFDMSLYSSLCDNLDSEAILSLWDRVIFCSPRVGLMSLDPDFESRCQAIFYPYRFLIRPWKMRKSRIYTLLGILMVLQKDENHWKDLTEPYLATISCLTHINPPNLRRYLSIARQMANTQKSTFKNRKVKSLSDVLSLFGCLAPSIADYI